MAVEAEMKGAENGERAIVLQRHPAVAGEVTDGDGGGGRPDRRRRAKCHGPELMKRTVPSTC